MKDKLNVNVNEQVEEIQEMINLIISNNKAIHNHIKNIKTGTTIGRDILLQTINEVSDPIIKSEFEERLQNFDKARLCELIHRYGRLLLDDRLVYSYIDSVNHSKFKKRKFLF